MMEKSQNPGAGVGFLSDSGLSGFLDNLPGMAYRYAWDGDWAMEFVSSGGLQLTGHDPEGLVENSTVSWSGLIHSDDLAKVTKRVRRAVKDRKPFQVEYRLHTSNAMKWVLEEGRVVSEPNDYPYFIEGYIVDISEQKAHEADLTYQQGQTRLAIEKARDAFLAVDSDGKIQDWNRQSEQTFGWKREEVLGRGVVDTIVPPERRDEYLESFKSFMETQVGQVTFQSPNLTARRRNGEEFPIELTIWPSDSSGRQLFNSYVHDLTEQQALEGQLAKAEDSLERLMREDSLTGLPNRKALEGDLTRSMSFARRWKQPLSLIMANLDALKSVNDELGRSKGDALLVAFANALKASSRLEDLTARLEGSKFALLLPNTDLANAQVVANRLRKKLQEDEMPVETTVSATVGIAEFDGQDTIDTFVRRATQALNQAKDGGTDSVETPQAGIEPVGEPG